MSHTIAKSITITPKTIKITGASSNSFLVSPAGNCVYDWQTVEWPNTRERLHDLWEWLSGGMVQPTTSANGYKWACCMAKCENFIEFQAFLATKQPTGKYAIKSDAPYPGYFRKYGRCFCSTPSIQDASPMSYYEAQAIYARYKGANQIEVVKL